MDIIIVYYYLQEISESLPFTHKVVCGYYFKHNKCMDLSQVDKEYCQYIACI